MFNTIWQKRLVQTLPATFIAMSNQLTCGVLSTLLLLVQGFCAGPASGDLMGSDVAASMSVEDALGRVE